jgi:hypothetical protein
MQIISTMPYLTRGFIFGILCLTLIFHSRFTEKTVVYGPTILTTIGIFATFIGIAIGMSGFDVANIQASVPSLLSGLKTAFWASVAGVGAALTIKIRHFFLGVKSSSETGSGDAVSVDDLARSMRGMAFELRVIRQVEKLWSRQQRPARIWRRELRRAVRTEWIKTRE